MDREPTGIPGFDELVEGGLPRGSITLVAGSPGTGKSLFAQHFISTGATKFGQKGLYISFEQRTPEIFSQARTVGMDLEGLQNSGKAYFAFLDISQRRLEEGKTYIDVIREQAKAFGAQRLVIDSITPLANFPITSSELAYFGLLSDVDRLMLPSMQEDLIVRMQVHKLVMVLKDLKCTSIITSEIPRNSEWLSSDHASEFLADGLILLKYLGAGPSMTRSLTIEKMRATKHAEDLMPLSITQRGLVVRKPEDVYKA